jgi:poly-gamma-glutamate capsule biosynthesis protein CapA/YwtB (metallophosphatase superfamily)
VADIRLRQKGMAYGFSGEGITPLLKNADLTIINLETPLVASCPQKNVGMIFCGLPEFARELAINGVDIVGLANNHTLNYGAGGLKETVGHLILNKLEPLENYSYVVRTENNISYGFVGLNIVGPRLDREKVSGLIREVSGEVDVTVVSIHWGAEYELVPSLAPGVAFDDPLEVGKFLVDVGADLVVGHHPHVVQGVEFYKGKLIAYSLGNFMFDQEWSRETKEGAVGSFVFDEGVLVDAYFTPIIIEDWVRPRVANPNEADAILNRMRISSEEIRRLSLEKSK